MIRKALLLLLVSAAAARAQDPISFSGYIAEFFAVDRLNADESRLLSTDQWQRMNVVRVRLRPSADLWDGARLGVEYEASAGYQSGPSLLAPAGAPNQRQVFGLWWTGTPSSPWTTIHGFDRLYVQQELGSGEVAVGRQRIAWGTGRVWNPTDLFNPLNPVVPSKIEKDGVDVLLAKFAFASFTDLSFVCNPQRGWDRVNAGARFRTNISEFDLSIMGGSFDRRAVVGGDLAGSLFDAGVRAEGIVAIPATGSVVTSFIVGWDDQFSSVWYGMMEFYHNGDGAANPSQYDLVGLFARQIIALGREYVALSTSVQVHPLVMATATVIRNLNDGSGTVHATVSYAATEEVAIVAGAQLFSGSPLSEYWLYPDAGYLKVDWYF